VEKLLSPDEVETFERVNRCTCCNFGEGAHCYKCRFEYHPNPVVTWAVESLPADEFRVELEEIYALHAAKRSDYTAESADRLANYRFSSSMVGLSVERGMFMRLSEKLYRIKSIMDKGGDVKVLDEGLTDTLRDVAVIAILMKLSLQGGEYGAK
jgi:hypothetical protein